MHVHRDSENNHQMVNGPRFTVSGIVAIWSGNTVMQRSFICRNGHSFIVFDKIEGSTREIVRKIFRRALSALLVDLRN